MSSRPDAPGGEATELEPSSAEAEAGATTFSPEEEAALVNESNTRKTEANDLFSSAKYQDAIAKYDEAVATCPNYLDYELAVLKSNIAACYLKLDEWKEAVKSASEAVSSLDRLEIQAQEKEKVKPKTKDEEEADVEEEIVSSGAARAAPPLPEEESPAEVAARQRAEDIKRIRAKALMRRAKARGELGGWSNLAGAEEDYKTLSAMTNLGAADRRLVQAQLRILPPKVKAAQEKETQEMWGKLKDLGNGILKPFGLSTDNFQMAKDDKTGGYSMSFKSNEGKK